MGLFERLTANDETKISVHAFGAAMRLVVDGDFTVAQFKSAFNLTGDDSTQFDAIKAAHDAKQDATEKLDFVGKIHDAFILAEAGKLTKSQVKTLLGF